MPPAADSEPLILFAARASASLAPASTPLTRDAALLDPPTVDAEAALEPAEVSPSEAESALAEESAELALAED